MIPLRAYLALLTSYLRPHRRSVGVLALLVLADLAVQLGIPQLLRIIIDDATTPGPDHDLAVLAGLVVVGALLHQGLAVASTWVAERVGWGATNALRADLTEHVLDLDLGFHKNHPPGELLERVDGDVTALSNFFSSMVVKVMGNGLLIAGIAVLLVVQTPLLGMVLAAVLLVTLVAMVRLHTLAVPWWRAHRAAAAQTYGGLGEQVDGTEDIAANGAGPFMQERFADQLRRWMPLEVRGWTGWGLMWSTSEAMRVAMLVGVVVIGARQVATQALTIGGVYLAVHYTEMIGHPLHELREQMQDLQKAGAGIARVEELLATRSALAPAGTHTLPSGPLGVVFDHVDFTYDDGPASEVVGSPSADTAAPHHDGSATARVLHDIDLVIEPGRVVGIVGRTGSGKSTLARLVTRLYEPDVGEVRIGGIATGQAGDLRDRVAMVTQDVQLFRASVRDNITFFDANVDDERLHEAIALLGLDDWLASLPQGLDTPMGGDGVGVSAGQAQLLAFTRVFLRNPGVVVLDEASSRLDPATEGWLERAVDGLLADRTGIIIAHRLHTLRRADDVVVMQSGRIVEHGDRMALGADPSSHYAHLLATGMEEVLT